MLPLQFPGPLGKESLRASAGSAVPQPVYLGSSNLEVQTRLHDQIVTTRPQGSRSAAAAPPLGATPQGPLGTSPGYPLGCQGPSQNGSLGGRCPLGSCCCTPKHLIVLEELRCW